MIESFKINTIRQQKCAHGYPRNKIFHISWQHMQLYEASSFDCLYFFPTS